MEYWLNLNVTVFIGPDSLVAEINFSFQFLRAFFFLYWFIRTKPVMKQNYLIFVTNH